jgi:uncharacterized protein (TIGR00251 family)
MLELTEREGSVTFSVRVVPHASRTAIIGIHDQGLKIRLAAAPVDGAANEELIRYLSKGLAISQSEVEIVRGHTGRVKQVRVPADCTAKLLTLAGGR